MKWHADCRLQISDRRLWLLAFLLAAALVSWSNLSLARSKGSSALGETGSTAIFSPTVRYPSQDCGKNTWIGFVFDFGDDCSIKKVWSQACVNYWKNIYMRRAADSLSFDERQQIISLLDQGIEYRGFVGIWDQVIHDLSRGVIECP